MILLAWGHIVHELRGYGKHLSNNRCWSSLSQTLLTWTAPEDGAVWCICFVGDRSTIPSKSIELRIWIVQFRGPLSSKGGWIILGPSLCLTTGPHRQAWRKADTVAGLFLNAPFLGNWGHSLLACSKGFQQPVFRQCTSKHSYAANPTLLSLAKVGWSSSSSAQHCLAGR